MKTIARIIKAVVSLAIAAFVTTVIVGVFSALNAAPVNALDASRSAETNSSYVTTTTAKAQSRSPEGLADSTCPAYLGRATKSSTIVPLDASANKKVASDTSDVNSSRSTGSSAKPAPSTAYPVPSNPGGSSKPGSSSDASGADKVWIPPVTTIVHHDAVYKTVTHPAEYTTVEVIRCSCGLEFATNAEWSAHNKALGFGNGHSYSVIEKPVLVKDAWSEPVLVSAAWDEAVIIAGYWK